jgi:Domain of unknown function (DUF4062)
MGDVSPVVFVSYTRELERFPETRSFVSATYDAVRAAGCRTAAPFEPPLTDTRSADLRRRQVQACDAYLGLIGREYGPRVVDTASQSYVELEYDAAGASRLERLMFLLDPRVEIPGSDPADRMLHRRQEAFRDRVRVDGARGWFTTDEHLHWLIGIALRSWRESRWQPTRRRRMSRSPSVGEIIDDSSVWDVSSWLM